MNEILNWYYNYYNDSAPTKQVSKGRTLSGKELAKRKIRAKMAKASRKINRK